MLGANAAYVIEMNLQFNNEHLLLLKILTGPGTSGYNMFLNIFHWLFSLEYLEVSFACSISKNDLTPNRLHKQQRCFTIIKYLGLFVNCLPAIPLTYYEWVFEQEIHDKMNYGTPFSREVVIRGVLSQLANVVLQTVSVIVLAWALVRIKRQVSLSDGMVLNTKLMHTHTIMMALNMLTDYGVWIFLTYVAMHGMVDALAYSDIALFTMNCLTQVIIVMVFINISKMSQQRNLIR